MAKAKFRSASGRVIGYVGVAEAVRRAIAHGQNDEEKKARLERVLSPVIEGAIDNLGDPGSLARALAEDLGSLGREKLVHDTITRLICHNIGIDTAVDDEGNVHANDRSEDEIAGGNA